MVAPEGTLSHNTSLPQYDLFLRVKEHLAPDGSSLLQEIAKVSKKKKRSELSFFIYMCFKTKYGCIV